jgi:hypothetical protein
LVFQYSPAGFEEYFIENGTLVEMPTKEKLKKNMQVLKKNREWVIKSPLLESSTNAQQGVWLYGGLTKMFSSLYSYSATYLTAE